MQNEQLLGISGGPINQIKNPTVPLHFSIKNTQSGNYRANTINILKVITIVLLILILVNKMFFLSILGIHSNY